MISKIFVNLPVKDLDKSMAFFKAIGFSFNPQFTDKTAACMVMSEDIYAMLLTHDKVKQFTGKEIADAHRTTEVLTALGFMQVSAVRKTRQHFSIESAGRSVEGAIDRVDDVGTFVELELAADDAGLEAAGRIVGAVAEELQLGASERRSYLEMLLERRS